MHDLNWHKPISLTCANDADIHRPASCPHNRSVYLRRSTWPSRLKARVLIALLYDVAGAKQGIGLHLIKKLHAKGWTVHASVRSLTKDAESIAEVLPTSEVPFLLAFLIKNVVSTFRDRHSNLRNRHPQRSNYRSSG